ncbi:hypothetical protein J7E96_32980 [Streptomyces sp. ISL-96]|uniref:hypothetical protein n=1 Tax=Streptomyces sp. ISL-96 TaxID=2819191 RepID=UPI001BE632CB|nr:hypothetical protein [Streptomyces sp. ISL-96]MBT2493232.1 hypothetical protein [Streptomyces sp. ISL-96]
MCDAERTSSAAAATESRICQMLREHLVEVIASIRSQAEMVQVLALDPQGGSRAHEATVGMGDTCSSEP